MSFDFHRRCRANWSVIDPTLLTSFDQSVPLLATAPNYTGGITSTFQPPQHLIQPPSPALSETSSHDSPHGSIHLRSRNTSPYIYHPYPQSSSGRRNSVTSRDSRYSHDSPRSGSLGFDEDGRERGRCPNPDCGRLFKDLKAHMLTHQSERPEKCPIVTCEYHTKGFARKYDRCRHTLTHYKGTMVCDFCPGGGSAAEKSFNRADVFKRHLTSVHAVEQSPPNARKKGPATASSKKTTSNAQGTAGKCSTCSSTFNNAQDFYDHLDDCVLRSLEQAEPSEAINEQHLTQVANDRAVQETMDRHLLPTSLVYDPQDQAGLDEDDEDVEEEEDDEDDMNKTWTTQGHPSSSRSGKGGIKSTKRDSS